LAKVCIVVDDGSFRHLIVIGLDTTQIIVGINHCTLRSGIARCMEAVGEQVADGIVGIFRVPAIGIGLGLYPPGIVVDIVHLRVVVVGLGLQLPQRIVLPCRLIAIGIDQSIDLPEKAVGHGVGFPGGIDLPRGASERIVEHPLCAFFGIGLRHDVALGIIDRLDGVGDAVGNGMHHGWVPVQVIFKDLLHAQANDRALQSGMRIIHHGVGAFGADGFRHPSIGIINPAPCAPVGSHPMAQVSVAIIFIDGFNPCQRIIFAQQLFLDVVFAFYPAQLGSAQRNHHVGGMALRVVFIGRHATDGIEALLQSPCRVVEIADGAGFERIDGYEQLPSGVVGVRPHIVQRIGLREQVAHDVVGVACTSFIRRTSRLDAVGQVAFPSSPRGRLSEQGDFGAQ